MPAGVSRQRAHIRADLPGRDPGCVQVLREPCRAPSEALGRACNPRFGIYSTQSPFGDRDVVAAPAPPVPFLIAAEQLQGFEECRGVRRTEHSKSGMSPFGLALVAV
jgi:hypothetical protein